MATIFFALIEILLSLLPTTEFDFGCTDLHFPVFRKKLAY
jgi:hypothetical protein